MTQPTPFDAVRAALVARVGRDCCMGSDPACGAGCLFEAAVKRVGHDDPDPLLSIRKSRLEAALRAAYTEGADVGGGAGEHVAWAQIDAYIARALTELEQA